MNTRAAKLYDLFLELWRRCDGTGQTLHNNNNNIIIITEVLSTMVERFVSPCKRGKDGHSPIPRRQQTI